jgi:hypothetical protein
MVQETSKRALLGLVLVLAAAEVAYLAVLHLVPRPVKSYNRLPEASLEEYAVDEPAPEIDGEDIEGRPLRLSAYRGQVVVLDFWVHW